MPMPSRYNRGSEEFYSTAPSSFSPVDYNGDTLGLLREAQSRRLNQLKDVGQLQSEAIQAPGEKLGAMIGNAPKAYEEGREYKRKGEQQEWRAEEHGKNMTRADKEMEGLDIGNQDAKTKMEAARRRDEMLRQRRESGLTAEEQQLNDELAKAPLDRKLAEAQIDNYKKQGSSYGRDAQKFGFEVQDRETAQLSAQIGEALRAGDTGRAELLAKTSKLPPGQIAKARGDAQAAISGGANTNELLYTSKPEGAEATRNIQDLKQKVPLVASLADEIENYKNAYGNTEEEERIRENIQDHLTQLGEDPRILDSMFSVEGGRESRAEKALQNVQRKMNLRVSMLEKTYGDAAPPAIKQQIMTLKEAISQVALKKPGGGAGNVDLFSGSQRNNVTKVGGFLKNGPTPAPTQAPAAAMPANAAPGGMPVAPPVPNQPARRSRFR